MASFITIAIGPWASGPAAVVASISALVAGCGTLNQPTSARQGDFALGLATTTRIEAPKGGDSNIDQGGEIWLRYAALKRAEVYVQASVLEVGFHLGGKSLLIGDFELFDDHSAGLLLAVDGRVGYWPKGDQYEGSEPIYDASLAIPIGYAWSQLGFASAAPSTRIGVSSGHVESHELGLAIGFAQSPSMGDVVLPPLGLEVFLGRELRNDVSLAVLRMSVQLPVF